MRVYKTIISMMFAGWLCFMVACKPKEDDDRELIPSKENKLDSSIYKMDTTLENPASSEHMTNDNRNI